MHQEVLLYNKAFAADAAAKLKYLYRTSYLSLLYPPVRPDMGLTQSLEEFYSHPYFLFSVFISPLLLLFRNRVNGLPIMAISLVVPFLITSIPVITLGLISLTFNQVVFGGPALFTVFQFYYLIPVALFWFIFQWSFQRFPLFFNKYIFILLGIAAVLPVVLHVPQWIYTLSPILLLIWLIMGTLWAVRRRRISLPFSDYFGDSLVRRKNIILLPLATVLLISLYLFGDIRILRALTPDVRAGSASGDMNPTPLPGDSVKRGPDVSNWKAWYRESQYRYLPLDVAYFIRNDVPKGKVFAAPFYPGAGLMRIIASLTDQFVYSTESYSIMIERELFRDLVRLRFNTEPDTLLNKEFVADYVNSNMPFLRGEGDFPQRFWVARSIYNDFMPEFQPIFNTIDTPETTLYLMRHFGIEYVYVPPQWRQHLIGVFSQLNGSVEKIYDKDLNAIFKVGR